MTILHSLSMREALENVLYGVDTYLAHKVTRSLGSPNVRKCLEMVRLVVLDVDVAAAASSIANSNPTR